MDSKAPERWKDIFTTYDDAEAALIAGLLKGEGIQCRVESSKISPFPVSVGKMGEIKVLVHIDDFEKAAKALEDARLEEEEEP